MNLLESADAVAFSAPPSELLRAVVLGAVVLAADNDPQLMLAAWYATRTALEVLPAASWSEQGTRVLEQWSGPVRAATAAVWTPPPAAAVLKMPALSHQPDPITVDSAARSRAGRIASGHSGNYTTFANLLMNDFEGLVDELVSEAADAATEAHRRTLTQLKTFASRLGQGLGESLATYDGGIRAAKLRTDLLWWRQTAFSEGLSAPIRRAAQRKRDRGRSRGRPAQSGARHRAARGRALAR